MREHEARVIGIYTAHAAGKPMIPQYVIEAIAGKGLRGDRYTNGVSFISSESNRDPIRARRNLVIEGIELSSLVGRLFWIGDCLMAGTKSRDACSKTSIEEKDELRAIVLKKGEIRNGAKIRIVPN